MDSEIRTLVHIADLSGHTEMELTKAETLDVINQNDDDAGMICFEFGLD